MGIINIVNKWNLEEKKWKESMLYYEKGRSTAFANYEEIINSESKGFDYIILASGTRVEDHSKDYINIKEYKCGIDKIISFFKRKNKNVVIKLYLMDADAPIIEDAKLLAEYIDKLSLIPNTNSINLIGISKCGAMAFNIPKYFQNISSFDKTNIYTIATPFNGAKLASPKIFYPEVKKLITAKIGDNKIANLVYNELISIYEVISSNSHMDYDIAMQGGIPDSKLHLYDESLIKNMFSNDNIDAVSRLSSYKNLVTGIDNKTLKEAIRTMNFSGIGLCILNDLFFGKQSDGMIMISSQRIVESKMGEYDLKSHVLESSHHNVTSNNRVINDILHIVDDTIDEHTDKIKYKIRKKVK